MCSAMCSETANYPTMMPESDESTMDSSYQIDKNLLISISNIDDLYANEEYIRRIFQNLNLGIVQRVDFQRQYKTDYTWTNMAIIYMHWYDGVVVENLQDKILDEYKEARVVHDDPQFWVLQPNFENHTDQTVYMRQMMERIKYLEHKNSELVTSMTNLTWWIRRHNQDITYICTHFKPNNAEVVTAEPQQWESVDQPTTNIISEIAALQTTAATGNSDWTGRLRSRSDR